MWGSSHRGGGLSEKDGGVTLLFINKVWINA